MNIAELTGIGGAVIGDLEMYGVQLKDDLEMAEETIMEMREEIEWLKANVKAAEKAKELWMADALSAKKKIADNSQAVTLVRNMLDEIDLEDDDENTRELRKIYWNEDDDIKQLKAEHAEADEESNTAAWNEMNVGI